MIEFVTLYLGLVAGLQPVEVTVGPEVDSVEIRLDGQSIASITSEPWWLNADFGARLRPHRLEAIGYGADGEMIASTEQWLNVPRPRAEAKLALDRDASGTFARVIWESLDFDEPRKTTVSLDGKELSFDDPKGIPLPRIDPKKIHFLTAELEFSDTVTARAEAVFGGTYGDTVSTDLSSVILYYDRARPPSARELRGNLLHRQSPLEVVAVERPPAEIIVVREQSAGMYSALQRLMAQFSSQWSIRSMIPKFLRPVDRVRFVFTEIDAGTVGADRWDMLPVSGDARGADDRSLLEVITRLPPLGARQPLAEQRITDAVAVAGLVAAGSNRRRVVILLTASDSKDVSRLVPEVVRDYLASLHVPLVVWRLQTPQQQESDLSHRWGQGDDVSNWGGFSTAFRKLRKLLDAQTIVWVEGRYLQHEIDLASDVRALRLADPSTAELEETIDRLAARGELWPQSDASLAKAPGSSAEDSTTRTAPLTIIDPRWVDIARSHLGETELVTMGPVQLITDHQAPRLWRHLERRVHELPELYSAHYGVAADLSAGAVAALFSSEDAYRDYAADLGRETGKLLGHASPGFLALYAGDRSPQEITDTFTHEITHLLNFDALGSEIPTWLDEGLAESMSLAATTSRSSLSLAPLDPRRIKATGGRAASGPLSVLPKLADALERDRLVTLAELEALARSDFETSDAGDELYALAAFWVHFLGTVDADTRVGFNRYLAGLSSETTGSKVSVFARLEADADELESSFRSWLRWLAEELVVLYR